MITLGYPLFRSLDIEFDSSEGVDGRNRIGFCEPLRASSTNPSRRLKAPESHQEDLFSMGELILEHDGYQHAEPPRLPNDLFEDDGEETVGIMK